MSTYVESKKALDEIRSKYCSAGDVIFRAAISMVVECGQYVLLNDVLYNAEIARLDANKFSYHFEKAIYECARELAFISSNDLIVYIQKEVWFSNEGGMDYQRVTRLLQNCMDWIDEDHDELYAELDTLLHIGFTNDELSELGYGFLLDIEEESEDD